MALARENATTLYQQLAETLRQEIDSGVYDPSGKLPSENQLGERFGVSRVTVRLALKFLTEQGLIERKQGKGSYVSGRKVMHGINVLKSFHESLVQQGLNATMRLLAKTHSPAPKNIAHLFTNVHKLPYIERVHLVDGEPIAVGHSFLSAISPSFTLQDIERRPTWSLLESTANEAIVGADITIRLHFADSKLAAELHIGTGAPLFLLERTSWFVEKRCAEYSLFYIRPERYEFTLNNIWASPALR